MQPTEAIDTYRKQYEKEIMTLAFPTMVSRTIFSGQSVYKTLAYLDKQMPGTIDCGKSLISHSLPQKLWTVKVDSLFARGRLL